MFASLFALAPSDLQGIASCHLPPPTQKATLHIDAFNVSDTKRTGCYQQAASWRQLGQAHGPVRCPGLEVHQTDTYHIAAIKAHANANANVDSDDASVSANCIGRRRLLLLLL